MHQSTMEDYKRELKGAGPKLQEYILRRATVDFSISISELVELYKYVYSGDMYHTPLPKTASLQELLSLIGIGEYDGTEK